MTKRVFPLGNAWLLAFLVFLGAFAPLSTDMFLPALPEMSDDLGAAPSLASLTISCFVLVFALSMLVWGPLSDRLGRRPVLLTGAILYAASSAAVALADSMPSLLAWRGVQAVGSGAVSAMSLAVIKDVLTGRAMEKAVTRLQTLTIIAPMLAPVIGGGVLLVTDWRGIFWCLTLCGLLALCGALALSETRHSPEAPSGPLFASFDRIPRVLAHGDFSALLVIFSAACMPFMAYIAVSSSVFQETFGLSAQAYSGFFAFNAAMSLAGPLAYERLFFARSGQSQGRFIAACLLLTCLAGGLLTVFGGTGAVAFALLCAPASFCTSAIRPPATVLMMSRVPGDNGTVSALINSAALLFGSAGMLLCSLAGQRGFIAALGGLSFLVGGLASAAWLRLNRRRVLAVEQE